MHLETAGAKSNETKALASLDTNGAVNLSVYPLAPVLSILLQDYTTKGNIVFATDSYLARGERYSPEQQMTPELLRGWRGGDLSPRSAKDASLQSERTRKSAEVATPAWVCRRMLDLADSLMPDAPTANEQTARGDDWQDYVKMRWLELTCGEAPFLVSRYDASSGRPLPLEERVGILDRKMRLVNAYARDKAEWQKWTECAFQSVYGYELQGDSLLLARINLLFTFVDYAQARWQHPPELPELRQIATVISRNLWQMDGLTGTVPRLLPQPGYHQLELFAADETDAEASPPLSAPQALIYLWQRKKSLPYLSLQEAYAMKHFDFVVGNPPYQLESENNSESNGQAPRTNIFHYFQMEADKIASKGTVLIYPGKRWIQRSGKGMQKFGLAQINDPHLQSVYFYPQPNELFTGVGIADGVSIVLKDMDKNSRHFTYTYCAEDRELSREVDSPGAELLILNPNDYVLSKKLAQWGLKGMHERILSRSLFGIESDFVEKNPQAVRPYRAGDTLDIQREIKLLANDQAGKAGKTKEYIAQRDVIAPEKQRYIEEWQVIVSSANAGGVKRDRQLSIADNHTAFGRSRLALGSFKTEQEARNFYAYVSSSIISYAFLLTDENLSTLGKMVPDLGDYTAQQRLIDFTRDIDAQLRDILGITAAEFAYIEERLKR